MMAAGDTTEARTWWAQRRLSFSAAVFAGFAITVVLWELLTPSWAGDHIGLSFGAVSFYAVGGLIWVGAANVVYFGGRLGERFVSAERLSAYRRYAYGMLVAAGATSSAVWFGGSLLEAWLRRR